MMGAVFAARMGCRCASSSCGQRQRRVPAVPRHGLLREARTVAELPIQRHERGASQQPRPARGGLWRPHGRSRLHPPAPDLAAMRRDLFSSTVSDAQPARRSGRRGRSTNSCSNPTAPSAGEASWITSPSPLERRACGRARNAHPAKFRMRSSASWASVRGYLPRSRRSSSAGGLRPHGSGLRGVPGIPARPAFRGLSWAVRQLIQHPVCWHDSRPGRMAGSLKAIHGANRSEYGARRSPTRTASSTSRSAWRNIGNAATSSSLSCRP